MASPEPITGRCGAAVSPSERNPDGGYCELRPMKGQRRCGSHGGRAPQNLAAAERRLQEEAGRAYAAKYGYPQHIEWREAVQLGLDETYGNLLAMRDLIQRLAPEALTWGETEIRTIGASQFPGIDVTQAAGIVPLVKLYGEERDRLHRQAVDAGKLNLDERRQELEERQARQVADLLTAALSALDALWQAGQLTSLSPSDPTVLRVLSEQLPALAVA